MFYVHCNGTGKQTSLKTRNEAEARNLLASYNESANTAQANRVIGMAFISQSDPEAASRTWQLVFQQVSNKGRASTKERRARAFKHAGFDLIRDKKLIHTKPQDFLKVLKKVGAFASDMLKLAHNEALGLDWITIPILPPKKWPKIKRREKKAITSEQHSMIIEAEKNEERRLYYEMCWHTGASQTDVANLTHENINWDCQTLSYKRVKLSEDSNPAVLTIGERLNEIILSCPDEGPLFPTIINTSANDRAAEFRRRTHLLGIKGVSLHSYRYAWAQRAAEVGYSERFAKFALGHNSSAVHQHYARNAEVKIPSLEEYVRN